jgi:hypothetical protein
VIKSALVSIVRHFSGRIKLILAVLSFLLILIFISILFNLNTAINSVSSARLSEIARIIEGIIFRQEIYLTPDSAYLAKITPLFYNSDTLSFDYTGNSLQTSITNIVKNIKKGIDINRDIRSVYIMAGDAEAPFVLVNGDVRQKIGLLDVKWMDSCFSMDRDRLVEWRNLRLSFTRNIDIISVYNKVSSWDWADGNAITGYIVINYEQKSIENQIKAVLGNGMTGALFDPVTKRELVIGGGQIDRQAINDILNKELRRGTGSGPQTVTDNPGVFVSFPRESLYVTRLAGSPLYLALTQVNQEFGDFFRTLGYKTSLIVVICLLMIVVLYINNHAWRERMLRTEVDLLYSQAQINSHFLLNTMDSVYWKIVGSKGPENEESGFVEKLCLILRYNLDSSRTMAPLKEEIEYARLYLALQRMRKQKIIRDEWDIPDADLRVETCKLIIQPILENVILHGFSISGTKEITILVHSEARGNKLSLYFEDNGRGIPGEKMYLMNRELRENGAKGPDHIGLMNINRRLKLQYGDQYGVFLSPSKLGGLRVELRLFYVKNDT